MQRRFDRAMSAADPCGLLRGEWGRSAYTRSPAVGCRWSVACRPLRGVCGLSQHGFDFDGDLDPVADHHTAALEGHVERHPEIAAVERTGGGEAAPRVAVGV